MMMNFWSDLALLTKYCKIPNISPGHIEDFKHFWWAYIWGACVQGTYIRGSFGQTSDLCMPKNSPFGVQLERLYILLGRKSSYANQVKIITHTLKKSLCLYSGGAYFRNFLSLRWTLLAPLGLNSRAPVANPSPRHSVLKACHMRILVGNHKNSL